MTIKQLEARLKSLGCDVSYHHFNKPPRVPYIVYLFPNDNNFAADGVVYQSIIRLAVELYTDKKDFALECKIQRLLTASGLCYTKSEVYIQSEKLYQIRYESEVIINE